MQLKYVQLPMNTLTLEQLAEIVLFAPGVEYGFLQPTFALDKKRGLKDGGQDAPNYAKFNPELRVCLYSGNKHAEAISADFMKAVASAFAQLDVPLPPSLQPHTSEENFIAWGIEEVTRERRFHPRFEVTTTFLRERLHIDDRHANAIHEAVSAKTKLKEEEKK